MHFSRFLLLGFVANAVAAGKVEWWARAFQDKDSCPNSGKNEYVEGGTPKDCYKLKNTAQAFTAAFPFGRGYKLVAYSGDNCDGTEVLTNDKTDQRCAKADKGAKSYKILRD